MRLDKRHEALTIEVHCDTEAEFNWLWGQLRGQTDWGMTPVLATLRGGEFLTCQLLCDDTSAWDAMVQRLDEWGVSDGGG